MTIRDMYPNAYEPKPYDIAGFDLVGYRQLNGMIKLGSGELVDEFPVEVAAFGNVYTLEEIKLNEVPKGQTGDPTMCWALYV